jgi:ubiquinone/menaquinone biosynthesis C-methylase UbiE
MSTHETYDTDSVARAYDRLAPLYDLVWDGLVASRAHRLAQRRAALKRGEGFLELGVGTGLTFVPMVRANPDGRNEGIDLSQGMLRICGRRLEQAGLRNHSLRLADVRELPFEAREFDVVLACYLFDTLPERDWIPVMGEILRVLRNGGRLVVTTLVGQPPRAFELLREKLPGVVGWLQPTKDLAGRLVAAGFLDVSTMGYNYGWTRSEVLRGVKVDDGHPFEPTHTVKGVARS